MILGAAAAFAFSAVQAIGLWAGVPLTIDTALFSMAVAALLFTFGHLIRKWSK